MKAFGFTLMCVFIVAGMIGVGGAVARDAASVAAAKEAKEVKAIEQAQVGRWQVTPLEGDSVFEMDTTDGHGFIVMPQGVIDVGTPANPSSAVKERPGVPQEEMRL